METLAMVFVGGDRVAVAVLVKIHNTGELNGNVVQER